MDDVDLKADSLRGAAVVKNETRRRRDKTLSNLARLMGDPYVLIKPPCPACGDTGPLGGRVDGDAVVYQCLACKSEWPSLAAMVPAPNAECRCGRRYASHLDDELSSIPISKDLCLGLKRLFRARALTTIWIAP